MAEEFISIIFCKPVTKTTKSIIKQFVNLTMQCEWRHVHLL